MAGNKKQMYYAEAERLYTIDQLTILEIADRLHLCEKTIRTWKDEGDWTTRRKQILKSKESFHEELYEFARKLMRTINDDLDNKRKVDAHRLYALTKLLPMFVKVKDYEQAVVSAKNNGEPKNSADIVKIVNEILGC